MMFTPLPEPAINCSHVAIRSPLIMRVETIWDTGSFTLNEYKDRRPIITMEGDTNLAGTKVSYMISSLLRYLEKHFMHDLPTLRDYPGRYEIDLRLPDYRLLMGECNEGGFYRTLVFGTHDIGRIRHDLWAVHHRLADVYAAFFHGYLR